MLPRVAIAGSIFAIVATLSPTLHALVLDREGGEPWRWLTGSFAHASASHLTGNAVAFFLLMAIRERAVGSLRATGELVLLLLGVAAGVRALHVDWVSYQGLSGVVYGQIVLLLADLLPSRRTLDPAPHPGWRALAIGAIFLGLVAKTVLEYARGDWLFGAAELRESLGVAFYPGAHLAGLAVGSLLAGLRALRARRGAQSSEPVAVEL